MKYFSIVSLILVGCLLNACNQTKEVLGFNRKVNDEFDVATTAPLTLPPDFNKLPEPKENTTLVADSTTSKAKDIALGQLSEPSKQQETDASSGELDLLKRANATDRNPDIRRQLDSETKVETNKNQSFVKDLLAIKDGKQGDVIDPVSENERLKNLKEDE